MSTYSDIEWTDATWNPVRGCTKISPGCKNCYAETFAERWRGIKGHPYEQGFDLRLVPDALTLPLKWRKPKRIFVNSMSDLFHEGVPGEYILRVHSVMEECSHHTFQVLTKRADRMSAFLHCAFPHNAFASLSRHIWWGVSVEDRRHGLPRIDALRTCTDANTFLSIEPLLEDLGDIDLSGIKWVIIGGESGRRARPCNIEWVRSIVRQCRVSEVPVFVKQLGANPVMMAIDDWRRGCQVPLQPKDPKGGHMPEWPADLRIREFPCA